MTRASANARAAETPAQPTDDESVREEARRLLAAEQAQIEDADTRNPVLPSPRNNPFGGAQILVDRFFTKNNFRQLTYYHENWYSYYERLWSVRTEDDIAAFLHNRLLLCRQVDSEGEVQDFVTSRANVSEFQFQIQQMTSIPSHFKAPCIYKDGKWKEIDARGKMVCLGKLVDMISGKVQSNHNMFIPNGANWEYEPEAEPSTDWLKFLNDLFGDKADEIELLQEWFGYVLAGDTWAQKGLIIVGPKRAGKGIIGHILKLLLGTSMVSSPALHALGGTFGLESLVDKRLCLVSDARLSNRIDTAAVIEMLLRIVACDPVDVNRKHKGALQMELDARVMMLSNEMPQLGDNSDAINSRFLILSLTNSFFGNEDFHLLDRLSQDLPAIANWAVQGYRRLQARGAFIEPKSSVDARQEWYEEGNPLAQFIDDECQTELNVKLEMTEIFEAYKRWCEERGSPFMASNAMSRRLSAILGSKIKRTKTNGIRHVEGIRFKTNSEKAF